MDRFAFLLSLGATAAPTQRALAAGAAVLPFASAEKRGRGRLGVAAIDVRDGRNVAQRAHERFPLASTFKLPLVIDVLARVDRGAERLDRKIAFHAGEIIAYSPSFGPKPHDGTKTVAELCEAAIEHSDNTAANLLLRTVGGPLGLTTYLRSLGDRVTRLDRYEPALNDAAPGDVRDTTTPDAMANLLARLVRDPILTPASKARIFGWMRRADTGLDRIRAGVPANWIVGDKTGTTRTAGNDVAILWPPAGGAPVVLAIYFAEVQAADKERDAAIAGVARSVVRMLRSGP
jgi:beta-lactamase class A